MYFQLLHVCGINMENWKSMKKLEGKFAEVIKFAPFREKNALICGLWNQQHIFKGTY